jgi:glycosyltransferase involved in cell wall biosynthesis
VGGATAPVVTPLRVALNATFLQRPDTGSGQYLLHLVEQFHKPEYDVDAQLVRPTSDSNAEKLRFEQFGFPNAAQSTKADLAHVPYFGSALRPLLPTIVTIHDLIPIVMPAYRGSPRVRAYTQLVSWAAKRADAIIADSESSKRDIVKHLGIAPENIRVIYLAADAAYRPITDTAILDAVREKYKLPDQFVLYLGGFDQRKNVPNLLRALTKVAKGLGPECSFVFAGRLPTTVSRLFPDVQGLVKELELTEHVRFIGEVPEADKPALYTLAGCFAWPSYYEGFGLPVLEAMACGTPVVAGDTSSLPEIVGNAGFLIAPEDLNHLAGAIIACLIDEDLRASFRAKGLARAATFSWQKCARETVEVYHKALGR